MATEHAPVSEAGEPGTEKKERLSKAQWAEATRLYELGTVTIVELAETYKISRQAISDYFKRHGIVKGSKSRMVAEAITSGVIASASKIASEFEEQRQQRIEDARTESYTWQTTIGKLNIKIVAELAQKKITPDEALDNLKALKLASHIAAQTRQERFAILRIGQENESEGENSIQIDIMSDAEVEAIRRKKDEDEDDEILVEEPDLAALEKVVFEGFGGT